MEMHQIRYFLAVSDQLNFSRAADSCNVAQPSLTRAIKKLEEQLGGPLFDRERGRVRLTEFGRLIHPHLQQIFEASKTVLDEANGFRTLERAPVRLGAMGTINPSRVIGFLDRLRTDIPTLDLSVHEATGGRLVEEMLAGDLDVALIGLPSFPDRLNAMPLYKERYVICFREGHRFGDMSAVPLRELDGIDYLLRSHCEFAANAEDFLGGPRPYKVNVVYRSEREEWIQAMILCGRGCAVMPESLPRLPGILTRALVEPDLARVVSLVTVAGRQFSPTVQHLTKIARSYPWVESV